MQIKREDKGHKGSFYIEEAGKRLAEMTFSLAGDHRLLSITPKYLMRCVARVQVNNL